MKRRPLILALGVMLLVVIGAAAWYLASPLFIDRTVEEEFPISLPGESEMEEMSELERQSLATEVMETAQAMPDERMEEPMPTERAPEEVRTGDFVGADSFHQGSGQARIFVLADGTRLLRLEDFMVTNGPDLHVLLATEPSPAGQDDLGDYEDLGTLKGNIGNQNYEIPLDLDLSSFRSVVIYCVPFHVVFATADLSALE